ncbi:hypothetical protein [Hydrogenothermus marinus]|uniref:Uncharacterized protein n=1 Tax=Hydrogenothermus marinus TaxID=133270 RepID=A0A3M0BSB6_9AQUI|nr:hypothetical protein [Hydrogenothermus marinus]RMB00072.1 hypothetical protein CLV39_0042 [Hydrogenothermus marinus]
MELLEECIVLTLDGREYYKIQKDDIGYYAFIRSAELNASKKEEAFISDTYEGIKGMIDLYLLLKKGIRKKQWIHKLHK